MITRNSLFSVLNLSIYKKKCLYDYAKSADTSLKGNPKKFWRFLNKNRSNHSDIPKVVSFNDNISSNEQESAELFVSYFSVYSSENIRCDSNILNISPFDLPNNVSLSASDIFHKISKLHSSMSVGPDGIPGIFIFNLRSIILNPFGLLFRLSLDEGIFPSMLKLG